MKSLHLATMATFAIAVGYLGCSSSDDSAASQTDAGAGDSGTTAIDTTSDAATPDAGTDDGTDASECVAFEDGNYTWGPWTCTRPGGTTDVRAFAISIGIGSVDETITGTTAVVNSNYAGTPACTRTTGFTLAYPSCGTSTSTTSTSYTCSATCASEKCTAGAQASLVDTYSISRTGNTFTTSRVLDAAFFTQTTLQKVAGCQAGDTEVATMIKQ